MLTLYKEDIKVFPSTMLETRQGKPYKYFMFTEKGENKHTDSPIYSMAFAHIDEPTCGFYKCVLENTKKTAYVAYDGQVITSDSKVELIDKYMNDCNKLKLKFNKKYKDIINPNSDYKANLEPDFIPSFDNFIASIKPIFDQLKKELANNSDLTIDNGKINSF